MFLNVLGSTLGLWLMSTPALWPENQGRGVLAAAAGLVALVGAVMAIATPRARFAVAGAGAVVALSTFLLAGEIGAVANFALTGLALVAIALPPQPHVVA